MKSRNCTRKRLAAGLCPDPLRELKRSPDLAAIWGLLLREWDGKEMEGEGRGESEEERERGEGK